MISVVNYLYKIITNFITMTHSGRVTLVSNYPHEIAKRLNTFISRIKRQYCVLKN